MRNAVALLALLVPIAACVTTPAQKAEVTLEHESGTTWRATYTLPLPARELRFERTVNAFRSGVFEVLTPGYAVVRDGDTEVLRTGGEPSRVIAVRFPEYAVELPKDYEFFQKFSDGSVAIYTGHLLAATGDQSVRAFRFVPRKGESIVVDGRRSASPAAWTDETGEGTYAYFGSIAPIETPEAISLVDPGLPDWLERRSREMLPRLFKLFTRRLGAALPRRPLVLFNYVPGDGSGYESGGGTLPNVIQLRVEGRAWANEAEEGLLHLFHFLAHEAAHLWNGQIANYPGTEHSWMHEGSADALAERALFELGEIDQARLLEYQTAALNACRDGGGRGSLREAGGRGEFELYYSCGNAIALLTDAAIDADLFTFWKTLVASAAGRPDRKYDIADYMKVWRGLGASDGDVARLESIVNDSFDPERIASALHDHGVPIRESDDVPQTHGQSLSRRALLHLLKQHCKGRYGFRSMPDGFHLSSPLDCGPFPAGGVVQAIGGEDVIRHGHRAWDALHRCGEGGSVSVRVDGRDLDVRCTTAVAARPRYLTIAGMP